MPHFLIRFSKLGSSRFISHLDLMELFRRAYRRASLPLAASGGRGPQPRLSLLQPLPVGTESLSELLFLELSRRIDAESLRERLSRQMPEGIRILEVRPLHRRFSFPLLDFTYRVEGDRENLPVEREIAELMSREELIVTRIRKGKERPDDIRPYLKEIRNHGDHLWMKIAGIDGRTARPDDVMAFLGADPDSFRVTRLGTCYGDR